MDRLDGRPERAADWPGRVGAVDPLDGLAGSVRVVEVGPRDGLQNQSLVYPTETKRRFVEELFGTGLREVEVTSFVRPDRVPQLADADALLPQVLRPDRACLALVANERGLARAVAAGARHLSVVAAASEGFSRANTGRGVEDGLRAVADLIAEAKHRGLWVRGYVSTCFRCPYDGPVPPARAIEVCWRLATTTVDEVVISDTLGDADPRQIGAVCRPLLADVGPGRLALHLHDTDELGLANLLAALELGMRSFDGSVGGLGGCPFAPGAAGNLATERIVRLCDRLGMPTGVDRERLRLARGVLTEPVG